MDSKDPMDFFLSYQKGEFKPKEQLPVKKTQQTKQQQPPLQQKNDQKPSSHDQDWENGDEESKYEDSGHWQAKNYHEELHAKVGDEIKEEWRKIQRANQPKVIEEDTFDRLNPEDLEGSLKLIGAVDIGYSKTDDRKGIAALVVCEYPSMRVVYEDYHEDRAIPFPYIPGFLAFKEVPLYEVLFERLKKNKPELMPQVLMVDGNGVLHPRMYGCACHIGVTFNLPTIGVAKNPFDVDGLHKSNIRDLCEAHLHKGGDTVELIGDSGKTWGIALRCTDLVKTPIYVSIGHRVSLATAVTITKLTIGKYRIPEPIRTADQRGRRKVGELFDGVPQRGRGRGRRY